LIRLSPQNRKRLIRFKSIRRGWVSLWILLAAYVLSLGSELLIGSRPLFVSYQGETYFPAFNGSYYPDTLFGGTLDVETDFRALAESEEFIAAGGHMLMPLHPFSPLESVIVEGDRPPARPHWRHPAGTDDRGRDVFARLVYGFRTAISFALVLAVVSFVVGIVIGAVQAYYGGWLDLIFQRLIEIWVALPFLYVVLMVSSIVRPSFTILVGILLIFGWVPVSRYTRAEILRERSRDYVTAARAQGASAWRIMFIHALPNSMTRFPRLWSAGPDAELGRAAQPGARPPQRLVADDGAVQRHVDHAAPDIVHRRGRARGLGPEDVPRQGVAGRLVSRARNGENVGVSESAARGPTMRRSLLRTLVVLVAVVCAGMATIVILGARRHVVRLSREFVARATMGVENDLERFFSAVRSNLLVAHDWGEGGLLDPTDCQNMNRRFIPVLERNPQVTSMMVARDDGVEWMLLRTPDGWSNRLTRREEWGQRTQWYSWGDVETMVDVEWRDSEYDPRRRPWFRGALAAGDATRPTWTAPYTFFTTRDPGITASMRFDVKATASRSILDPHTYVVAFDVMLLDLSRFTATMDVTENGLASVLTEDGRVLGLPGDPSYADTAAMRVDVMSPIGELGFPALTSAAARTDAGDAAFALDVDGARWWGGLRQFDLEQGPTLLAAVVVPEADFFGEIRQQRNHVLGVTFAALAATILVVLLLDRTFRRRMASEVARARTVGQYTLDRKLGSGGMGSVYLARHTLLRRPCAIKLMHAERAVDEVGIKRFEREVQLTASLTSPNTIAIYDYGRTPDGLFYYAMEFLDGVALGELIEKTGGQSPARVIHILRQACASLAEAHAVGLIHRDIKPANIMLCERGGVLDTVKVLDFGLVKDLAGDMDGDGMVTRADVITGTPLYMAPESIQKPRKPDARADLYALGAVGYYLLVGKPVFVGNTPVAVMAQHVHGEPKPPSERVDGVPADLEAVILRCLAKSPDDRPSTAAELAAALATCADADAWDQAAARRWWSEHAARLGHQASSEARSVRRAVTLEIDLGGR